MEEDNIDGDDEASEVTMSSGAGYDQSAAQGDVEEPASIQTETDPELADWFKVEDSKPSNVKPEGSDTESDADSDNQDVMAEDEEDDWLHVKSGDSPTSKQEVWKLLAQD